MKKYLSRIILTTLLFCFSGPLFAGQTETSIVVLSGDVGGTNARLRLTQLENSQKKHILAKKTYKVAEFNRDTLEIIKLFLTEYNKDSAIHINSLCLAVNEPIKNGKSFHYDPEQLKKELNIDNTMLINDLEAVGYGLESLTKKYLYTLREGTPEKNGLKAYVAAGTGFGMGFATFDGDKYVVHRSEVAGNTFTPSYEAQVNIYKYLVETPGKGLSAARALVRGQGIVDLYDYYRARKANDINNELHYIDSEELNKLLIGSKDKPKEIANFALNHNDDNDKDQIAVKALRSFVKIYSEKTRDVAYTLLPYGGLYIVGNIAVNILTKAPYDKIFSETFSNDDLLKDLPVYVVLDSEIGVQGAENCAFKLALN